MNSEQQSDDNTGTSSFGEIYLGTHLWGDRLMIKVGNLTAWLFPILMIAIISQVLMRNMGVNQAWLDDAQWWMYGFTILVGFGYSITTNSHVRVDIFYQNYSNRMVVTTEVIALGWLLMPFLILMLDVTFHYSFASWVAREGSDSPNGLHKLYILKISMPIMFVIINIATWAAIYRFLEKITPPTLWKLILATLPSCWFLFERLVYYILWWLIRFSQPELISRKISREPIMDYTTWFGLIVLLVVFTIAYLSRHLSRKE